MTLEEAIKTAIKFETKIRDLYFEAAKAADDKVGVRTFKALGNDEQHHLDYLNDKFRQWKKTGELNPEKLGSTIPSMEAVSREVAKLESKLTGKDRGLEQQMLSKALKVEIETSRFYKKMVDELTGKGQRMFSNFLEIEQGHINIVQAELDYHMKTGYWFDFKEFDME